MQADAAQADRSRPRSPTSGPTDARSRSGHLIRISLYWLGLTAIDGAVGLFIQNRVNFGPFAADPLEVGRILFLLSIPVAVISILIQPTVGSISDYTVSRWGRRKPYIVIGSLLDLVFLDRHRAVEHDPDARRVRGLAGGQHEHRPRAVPGLRARTSSPEKQVGLASAMVGLMQILGNVTGFVLVDRRRARRARSKLAIFAVAHRRAGHDGGRRAARRRRPAAQATERASRGRRSPARCGAPTSSRSARTSGC